MLNADKQAIINEALSILENELSTPGEPLVSSAAVKNYCRLQLAAREQEVFALILLNTQHELIKLVEFSVGTIDSASVYPREVVKAVLRSNAAVVILTHNHPSGTTEPSRADLEITRRLVDALALIDVRVLDHIVVGRDSALSFAEQGLL